MTLKKLHENGHSFYILGYSKLQFRKAMLKYGIHNEFINILSELCLNITEGNVKLPKVVKQPTKQHRSLVHALACKKKGKDFKIKQLVKAGGNFISLLLPIITGLRNIIF